MPDCRLAGFADGSEVDLPSQATNTAYKSQSVMANLPEIPANLRLIMELRMAE